MNLRLCLVTLFLLLSLVSFLPLVDATVTYQVSNAFIFSFPAYDTAMGFTSNHVFSNVTRIGNFWYFDGSEYSIQNGNLNVSGFSGNVFSGYVVGGDDNLATVSMLNPSFVTVPSSVTSSSAVVLQVLTSIAFLSSSVSCWFFDTTSYRTYVKVLISGITLFSIDFNAAISPGPGPGPGPAVTSTIQVADCNVAVGSGQSVDSSIQVSWTFFGSVTLTGISFQGNQAGWLQGSNVPLTLSVQNNSVPFTVSVPAGAAEGVYVVTVNSVFLYLGASSQSVKSYVRIVVGGGSPWWGFLNPIIGPVVQGASSISAYIMSSLALVLMSVSAFAALIVVAVVARKRR